MLQFEQSGALERALRRANAFHRVRTGLAASETKERFVRIGEIPFTSQRKMMSVLVLTQLFNGFNARSASASAFRAMFSNHWLWAAVALSTALQAAVVHLPFLNLAFGTVPLSAGQWGVCVAMASGVLWFSELRKLLRRLWTRAG